MTKTIQSLSELPFVKYSANNRENQFSFWKVSKSHNAINDIKLGEQYAVKAIEFMSSLGSFELMGWIVKDMPRGINFSAIEVGFFNEFSKFAVGSYNRKLNSI